MHRRLHLSVSLVLACLVGGCARQSTAPIDRDGPITVRVVDANRALTAHTELIDSLTQSTIARVTVSLPLRGVRVSVFADRDRAIAGWGIGGRTPDAWTVELYIDPTQPALETLLATKLPFMLAHELHHAARWRSPGGYGATLFEAMVSEGLADQFALEVIGGDVPPWSRALPDASVPSLFQLATAEFSSRSYNHARWFFGSTADIPRWTGYTLGFRVVRAYLGAHASASASSLAGEPVDSFRGISP